MISVKFFRRKRFRIVFIVTLFLTIVFLATFVDGPFEHYRRGKTALSVTNSTVLPLREISGIFVRGLVGDTGLFDIIAVGDKLPTLELAKVDLATEAVTEMQAVDFSQPIIDRFGMCRSLEIPACKKFIEDITSQWEAVNADASGRIFILNEQLASVVVYNPRGGKVDGVINLNSFNIEHDRSQKKQSPYGMGTNGLGEGMALLRDGHIMIAKEKNPATLIEFGPPGSTPLGYKKELSLRPDGVFALESERLELVPLQRWKLPKEYGNCDLSEINSDSEGNLYFLSQQCKLIGRIQDLDLAEQHLQVAETWFLPYELSTAEAFLILQPGHFVVAVDHKNEKKKNLFFLKQM